MNLTHLLGAAGIALALTSVLACSSDDDETASASGASVADCNEIIAACHPKDDGMQGELSSCHGRAHELFDQGGPYDECRSTKTSCIALCDAAPNIGGSGGHSHSGGSGGTHTGGTHAGGTSGSHAGGAHAGGAGGTHTGGSHAGGAHAGGAGGTHTGGAHTGGTHAGGAGGAHSAGTGGSN